MGNRDMGDFFVFRGEKRGEEFVVEREDDNRAEALKTEWEKKGD